MTSSQTLAPLPIERAWVATTAQLAAHLFGKDRPLPRSLRGAHGADVIATRCSGDRIELPTQSDLSSGVCHRTRAAGKRDQRSKPTMSGRQIDRSSVRPKELIAAL